MAGYTDKPWTPKFWLGMKCSAWLHIIARNHFAIAPHRIPMAALLSTLGPFHWSMAHVQRQRFGRGIRAADIHPQQVFILGHWRTGTTLLHELLTLDNRFAFPDTYACFAPNHFLVTRPFITPWLKRLMPKIRPTDNMTTGFDHPQEDEFALCNMGVPSPYLDMIFPNRPNVHDSYYSLEALSIDAREKWKDAYLHFLKSLSFRNPKPLILKSPYHMCRLPVLLELFPDARFIHITRDPYKVFPSTLLLWKRLYQNQSLQTPRYTNLEKNILDRFTMMYTAFEQQRQRIDTGNCIDVRYEDLVAEPVNTLKNIYRHLGLGPFDSVQDVVMHYLDQNNEYQPNHFTLTPQQHDAVTQYWQPLMEKYDYPA